MSPNKSLLNMSTQELGLLFPIIIEEANDYWKTLFERESAQINDLFPQSSIISVDHIGSTAIPNLKAKPTIDILVQITRDRADDIIIQKFESIGYLYIQKLENPPPHMMFAKGYTNDGFIGQAFHVHVRYQGDWDELHFRDYLKQHRSVALEYESLKSKLADLHRNDREAYTKAKTNFIERVNKLASE